MVTGLGGHEIFEAALVQASAELGHHHPVVTSARADALRLRKQLAVGKLKEREAGHAFEMLTAIESGDLQLLAGSIQAAAQALGPAHPAVETARQEYIQQRRDFQGQELHP
ncbi:unnamed protein product [Polarella glacialis]|uniref:Uncharacterized protein n=1 Tax=Polarella glacialis TaxID=89957 RepID=A0A813GLD5_POLGL|nr:unnamed protein product [Polarella glacialis]